LYTTTCSGMLGHRSKLRSSMAVSSLSIEEVSFLLELLMFANGVMIYYGRIFVVYLCVKMLQHYSRCMLRRASPMLQTCFYNVGFVGHIYWMCFFVCCKHHTILRFTANKWRFVADAVFLLHGRV
jgi:hypothetical protein